MVSLRKPTFELNVKPFLKPKICLLFLKKQWNQYRESSVLMFSVCCRWRWAFFGKVLWLQNQTGNAKSSFWHISKTTNVNSSLWSQKLIQSRLDWASHALIYNLSICIDDMVKDQSDLFLFSKTWKYSSQRIKDVNLPWAFCFTVRPWELWILSRMVKPCDMTGQHLGQTLSYNFDFQK